MKYINGIQISELRLIVHSTIFTILLLGLVVVIGFWVYTSLTMKNPKEKEHLRKLKEKAQSDELAKKQLEKLERRNKRRNKREKENIITDIFIWSISVCVGVAILAWGIIPGWTDYIRKDYVVYKGEITVYQQMRSSRIELEDGTVVWGIGDFDEHDTYGTVVYSRRTKRFLGGNIQSAFSIPDEEKRAQEIRPFRKIDDSFKKIIVTKDIVAPYYDEHGILTVNVYDFLLNTECIDG